MGPKWDTTNYIAEVCLSETGMLRGVTATSPSITWWLLFPKWDRCPKVGHSPNVIFSYAVILSSLCNWKGAQSYKNCRKRLSLRWTRAYNGTKRIWSRLCFCGFPIPLLFCSPFIWSHLGGRTWKYWPASGPVLFDICWRSRRQGLCGTIQNV